MPATPSTGPTPAGLGLDFLFLHPTGTRDPQKMSLALGLLELVRRRIEGAGARALLWTEAVKDEAGHARFALRAEPRSGEEIERKRRIVENVRYLVSFEFAGETPESARVNVVAAGLAGAGVSAPPPPGLPYTIPFDLPGIRRTAPALLDGLMSVAGRAEAETSSAPLFPTEEPEDVAGLLLSLERVVAASAGVGLEDPHRLFEPALLFMARRPDSAVPAECILRTADVVMQRGDARVHEAVADAFERWGKLVATPHPLYYLGLTHMRTGNAEGARVAFEESLRRDPSFLPALERYADWFAQRGFVDKALEVLQTGLGRSPHDALLFDQAGCILANAGRLDDADPLFRQAIERGGPPSACSNLARALLGRGRRAEALEALATGIAAGIRENTAIELLGTIGAEADEPGVRARAILRGMLVEERSDPEPMTVRVIETVAGLEGAQAVRPAAERLVRDSANPETRRRMHIALLRATRADFDEAWKQAVQAAYDGDARQAATFFSSLVEERPAFGAAHFFLAIALERLGDPSGTAKHAEEAVATEPADPLVLDLLARVRAAAGRLEEAARIHHTASTIAPGDPRILRNAAVSLLRAGYTPEGTALAHASLSLNADQPDLVEILKEHTRPSPAAPGVPGPGHGVLGKLGGLARGLFGGGRKPRS